MENKQYWLLTPGPVNTTETVRKAALGPDLCHREPEFGALMQGVRRKLVEAAGVPEGAYKAVLIAGSGTSAMELGVASLVRPGKSMLIVRNGVYGERIDKICELHGIERRHVDAPWTERPSLAAIEKLLREDASIDAVSLVHHETTTGLINQVREIGELARRYDKVFFLDSVSGFAGEELDLVASNVDVMACTANKCIHGLPGVAFLLITPRAESHIAEVQARSLYFDLKSYIKAQDAGTIPFTPCVPGTYTLDRALDELLEETVAKRIATYKERARILRNGLTDLGLELFLSPELRGNTITTFRLPEGVTYEKLHDALKADGFVIYAGQGKLATQVFRIANIGHAPMHVYRDVVESMRRALS